MASFKAVEVTLLMPNGTIQGPITLVPSTSRDAREITEILNFAKQQGRYDPDTGVIEFRSLGSKNLVWESLGVEGKHNFEELCAICQHFNEL